MPARSALELPRSFDRVVKLLLAVALMLQSPVEKNSLVANWLTRSIDRCRGVDSEAVTMIVWSAV